MAEEKASLGEKDYDLDYYKKVNEYMESTPCYIDKTYFGITDPASGASKFSSFLNNPPATSLPEIIQLMEADIKVYNSTYLY